MEQGIFIFYLNVSFFTICFCISVAFLLRITQNNTSMKYFHFSKMSDMSEHEQPHSSWVTNDNGSGEPISRRRHAIFFIGSNNWGLLVFQVTLFSFNFVTPLYVNLFLCRRLLQDISAVSSCHHYLIFNNYINVLNLYGRLAFSTRTTLCTYHGLALIHVEDF